MIVEIKALAGRIPDTEYAGIVTEISKLEIMCEDLLDSMRAIAWSNDTQWQSQCALEALAKAEGAA